MADSGVTGYREAIAVIATGAGALLVKDVWKWVKGRWAAKAEAARHRDELLDILADAAQWQLDEARNRERLTATGRLRPVTPEEIAEARGRDRERRQDIARRLWEATGHEERRGTSPKQDVFPEDDTE